MFTQSKYVEERAEPADRWGSLRGRKGTKGTRMGTSGTSGTWAAGFVGLGVLRERGLWGVTEPAGCCGRREGVGKGLWGVLGRFAGVLAGGAGVELG